MMKSETVLRKGDMPFTDPIQTSRYLEINDDWFFFTREKNLLGPYRSKRIIEHAVKLYIRQMKPQTDAANRTIEEINPIDTLREKSERKTRNNVLFFKHPDWNL